VHIFKEEVVIDDLGLDTFLWTRSLYETILDVEQLSSIKWKKKVFILLHQNSGYVTVLSQ